MPLRVKHVSRMRAQDTACPPILLRRAVYGWGSMPPEAKVPLHFAEFLVQVPLHFAEFLVQVPLHFAVDCLNCIDNEGVVE